MQLVSPHFKTVIPHSDQVVSTESNGSVSVPVKEETAKGEDPEEDEDEEEKQDGQNGDGGWYLFNSPFFLNFHTRRERWC